MIAFSVYFISIVIASAPPQIIRPSIAEVGDSWFKTLWQISQSTYRKSALALELFCQLSINVCMKLLKYMQQGYQTLGEEGGCVEEWGGEQVEAGEGRGNLWFPSHVPQRASLIWVHLPAWGPWVRGLMEPRCTQKTWVSWYVLSSLLSLLSLLLHKLTLASRSKTKDAYSVLKEPVF